MRKMLSGWKDAPYRLMALATVASLSAVSQAEAQGANQGISQIATNVGGTFDSITKLLLNGALLGGLGLSGAGLLKLKQASDDGGQRVKYGEGVWRLGVGGGLAALPFVARMMQQTVNNCDATGLTRQGTVNYN